MTIEASLFSVAVLLRRRKEDPDALLAIFPEIPHGEHVSNCLGYTDGQFIGVSQLDVMSDTLPASAETPQVQIFLQEVKRAYQGSLYLRQYFSFGEAVEIRQQAMRKAKRGRRKVPA